MTEAQYDLFGGSVPAKAEGAPPKGSHRTASLTDWAEVERRKREAEGVGTHQTIISEIPPRFVNTEEAGRYEVKCDDCKATLRRTDSMGESAAGGRCADCRRAK
jgi:hypothetical protein